MRRLYTLLIFLLAVLSSKAQESPKEFWVYRNDGVLHGFRAGLIDSITCSKFGIDSILYDDYVVQEIWMEDSVCRIPLSAIDSIGFTTPSTIFKEDVLEISDELREYVLFVSSSEIQLEKICPEHLLPQVGQKIATTKIDANFPTGFMGKVSSIDRSDSCITIQCQETLLTEIFDRYYTTFAIGIKSEKVTSGKMKSLKYYPIDYDIDFSLPFEAFRYGTPWEIEDILAIGFSKDPNMAIAPEGHILSEGSLSMWDGKIIGFFAIDGIRPYLLPNGTPWWLPMIDFSFTITKTKYLYDSRLSWMGDLDLSFDFNKSPIAKKDNKILLKLGKIPIPLPIPSCVTDIVAGLSLDINGCWVAECGFMAKGELGLTYNWTNNPYKKNNLKNRMYAKLNTCELKPTIIGGEVTASLCGFAEVDLSILDEVFDKCGIRVEFGGELGIECKTTIEHLLNKETTPDAYEDFKNKSGWSIYPLTKISIVGGIGSLEGALNIVSFPYREWFPNLNKVVAIVPTFDVTPYHKNNSIGLKRIVYPATPVGYKVVNGEGKEVFKSYYNLPYGIIPYVSLPMPFNSFPVAIPETVKIKKGYKIYPLVKPFYLDLFEMTASPSIDLLPIQISSVTTTAAQYRPTDHTQHFTYKDKLYEFKYNVATTVTLTNDEGVENWGYCYKGPENDSVISRISLKGAPYTYEDKRFTYYRNGSPTGHTARLYPFVKYTDDDKYYYGEPIDYPLIYPETSNIELTGCSTPEVVTRQNVEYNGAIYDYCSTFIIDYTATGAYWISVGAEKFGNGWNTWEQGLFPSEQAKAMDGSNRLTLNFYYNTRVLYGDYYIRLKGTDDTHEAGGCVSNDYLRLIHNGQLFTGCELKR